MRAGIDDLLQVAGIAIRASRARTACTLAVTIADGITRSQLERGPVAPLQHGEQGCGHDRDHQVAKRPTQHPLPLRLRRSRHYLLRCR